MPQQNEMVSLYYTALDFISKNEEYKLEKNINCIKSFREMQTD